MAAAADDFGDELTPQEVVEACVQIVETYDPAVKSIDAHADDALGDFDEDEDPDRALIAETLRGVARRRKPLMVLMNALYHVNKAGVNRSDYNLYMVLGYLALFALDDLGFPAFRALAASQEPHKCHAILGFLLDKDKVATWLVEEWSKSLDRTFIETDMLARIERHRPALQAFLDDTFEAAFGAEAVRQRAQAAEGDASSKGFKLAKTAKRTTVPKPFNLTKPKVRPMPQPERIPQKLSANPVNRKVLEGTSLAAVSKQARRRRERARAAVQAKYSSKDQFRLHKTKDTVAELRAQKDKEEAEAHRYIPAKVNELPQLPEEGATVRLTAAAVLREDAVLRKRQQKEAKEIARFETELRDGAEFHRWQQEAKEADEVARLQQVEERRQNAAMSAAEAKAAVEAEKRSKRAAVRRMQARLEEEEAAHRLQKQAEEEAVRKLAREAKHVRTVAPRVAEAQVREQKLREAEQLRLAAEAAERARKEEEAAEREERAELIRQLRALDKVPRARVSVFNPASHAGLGLMEEMSLVELRERLEMLKAREREEEEDRRQGIIRARREKEEALRAKVESVKRMRSQAKQAADQRRGARRQREAAAKERQERAREAAAETMAARLEQKRRARAAERAALDAAEEAYQKRAMFLGANKRAVEERKMRDVLSTKAREAARDQRAARLNQARSEQAAAAAAGNRAAEKRGVRRGKARAAAASQRAFEHRRGELEEFTTEERTRRKEGFFRETARKERLRMSTEENNLFAATVTRREQERARKAAAPRRAGAGQPLSVTAALRQGAAEAGDVDERRAAVAAQRMTRLTEAQQEATGMAETVEQSVTLQADARRRMRAAAAASAQIDAAMAKNLAARKRQQRAAAQRTGQQQPRRAGASGGGGGAGRAMSPVVSPGRERPGSGRSRAGSSRALAAGASVLMATPGEMSGWAALGR